MPSLDEVRQWIEADSNSKSPAWMRYKTPTAPAMTHFKSSGSHTEEDIKGKRVKFKPISNYIQSYLDNVAISSSQVPVAGDVAGLVSDAYRYITDPESRTLANYGLTATNLIPVLPYVAAGLIKRVKPASNIEKFVQDLEVAGFNRDEIWKKSYNEFGYGIFRGKDKKLRMEIPDTGAQLKIPEFIESTDIAHYSERNLEDILIHPKLFEMAPELKSNPIYTNITLDPQSSRKGYASGKEEIGVIAPTRKEATSEFFHELNHILQSQGELARGSSPQQVSSAMQMGDVGPKANELVQKALKGAIKLSEADIAKGLNAAISDEYWYNLTAHTLYRNLLGEVESRAVQRRLTRSPAELRNIPFYKDYDVGEDFIITKLYE